MELCSCARRVCSVLSLELLKHCALSFVTNELSTQTTALTSAECINFTNIAHAPVSELVPLVSADHVAVGAAYSSALILEGAVDTCLLCFDEHVSVIAITFIKHKCRGSVRVILESH